MSLNNREAYPITIGDFTVYCENFKASATTSYTEKPTVAGITKVTNHCRKSTEIIISGRICNEETPMKFVTYANNMTGGLSQFSIEYRGITFSKCRFKGYTVEDKGDEYIYTSITLITSSDVKLSGE